MSTLVSGRGQYFGHRVLVNHAGMNGGRGVGRTGATRKTSQLVLLLLMSAMPVSVTVAVWMAHRTGHLANTCKVTAVRKRLVNGHEAVQLSGQIGRAGRNGRGDGP